MRKIISLLILVFLWGCAPRYYQPKGIVKDPTDEICRQFQNQKSKLSGKRIAIAEFTDLSGNETAETKLFTERLTTSLATIEGLNIIERSQLKKLLKEQNFSHSGIVDSETAKKMGKILGVDVIVCGTIVRLERYWEINCRSINVENGKILTGVRVKAQPEAIQYTSNQEKNSKENIQMGNLPAKGERISAGKSAGGAGGGILKQRAMLAEADGHHRKALRYKNERKFGFALREADIARRILKQIIEINPNTPPAREAKRRLKRMSNYFKRRLR